MSSIPEGYVSNIEDKINYQFHNKRLLLEALTHSSYAYDNNLDYNYERLEFLGDAVLELIITEYLVEKYPDFQEGDLSILRAYIVNAKALSEASKQINLGDNILLGKSEFSSSNNMKNAIVADIFEALIAAVYLDSGYNQAKLLVLNLLENFIIDATKNNSFRDAKTLLQQICQRDFGKLPEYTLIKSEGPEHNKTFYVELNFCDIMKVEGIGKSKKEAEKNAAAIALNKYKK